MVKLDLNEVKEYVNSNIVVFHESKINILEKMKLNEVLKKKNPYLFKAKNINLASDFVNGILDAYLSSSEEKIFGDFLEELAIFISSQTFGGRKSGITGMDLEYVKENIHYIISIKSGPNWGNNSQQKMLEENFKLALKVLRQSRSSLHIEPILGICYGKTKTNMWRGIAQKIVGQNFWYHISENKNLYIDIIEPLGYKAKEHNEKFLKEKERLVNLFTQEFIQDFCDKGAINWESLVEFNSGNMP